jgi:hypothetical protein
LYCIRPQWNEVRSQQQKQLQKIFKHTERTIHYWMTSGSLNEIRGKIKNLWTLIKKKIQLTIITGIQQRQCLEESL